MRPESWERIKEILAAYRELPEGERETFLDSECGSDDVLRAEVLRLSDVPPIDFLDPPDPVDPRDTDTLAEGTCLAEFEILRELGRGGMGVVYLARQASLNRQVALKVLSAELFSQGRRAARFELEALAAAKLQHANIVHVLSAGEASGHRYIAMDYIDGANLGEILEDLRRGREEGRGDGADRLLPAADSAGYARRVAEVVRDIALALEFAHQNGILHRDVKPGNILLDHEGTAFLVDFGLAKDVEAESISVAGEILGTPHYMSPEQALAKRVAVDHRTDVFSLGAVLYELLTLERPFDGDSVQRILHAISFSEPTGIRKLNSRIHRDLETICAKAMEKDPARRFSTARAFAAELGHFLAHEPLSIRRTQPVIRLARRMMRNRPAAALGIVVLALLIGSPLAWRAARAAEVEGWLREAEAACAVPSEAEPVELGIVLGRLEALGTESLPTETAVRIATVTERIREEGRRRKSLWRSSADLAAAPAGPLGWAASDRLLGEAQEHLLAARVLLPDDPELSSAPDVRLPTIEVVGGEWSGSVTLASVDLLTGFLGPAQDLDSGLREPVPVPRGVYRFRFRSEEGLAELTRVLDEHGRKVELLPRLLPTAVVREGMVRIAVEESVDFGLKHLEDRSVTVAPFWIDLTEVTIGQFRRFLRETGSAPPRAWDNDTFRDDYERILQPNPAGMPEKQTDWDSHPVAGVNFYEAQAYAEWCGKRLPTYFELALAGRGPELRVLPWTGRTDSTSEELSSRAVLKTGGAFAEDQLEEYLARTVPVDSLPEGRSVFGLFHTLGNVKEWTETHSLTSGPQDGTVLPEPRVFRVQGGGWDTPPVLGEEVLFDLSCLDKLSAGRSAFSFGFRCATSDL